MHKISKYFTAISPTHALLKVTCIFWIIAKLMCWRLWTCYRLYPTLPAFDGLSNVLPGVHLILFALSLLLIATLLFKQSRLIFIALLITEMLSCLLDQTRLQPWEYQYVCFIFIFLVNPAKDEAITVVMVFIMSSIYFYSGCSKLNAGFLQEIWTRLILHSILKIPIVTTRLLAVYYSGYIIAFFELACGVLLLFPKTQKLAARALILLHVTILLAFGPWALNYNRIIWPWNAAMIFFLYILFLRKRTTVDRYLFRRWNAIIVILWGVLPALSFAGYWDRYLSSNLYSGNEPKVSICISDTAKCKPLSRFWKPGCTAYCRGQATIAVYDWVITETGVPPYPQQRTYQILEKKLEQQYPAAHFSFITFIKGRWQ